MCLLHTKLHNEGVYMRGATRPASQKNSRYGKVHTEFASKMVSVSPHFTQALLLMQHVVKPFEINLFQPPSPITLWVNHVIIT